jgi:isoleucyl-tRNA synthetase
MTVAQIRDTCRKYAQKYVDLQSKDFQRLGVFGRWNDPYLTMSAQYESVIAGAFVEFLDRGYVYKGLKPVNWCIRDRTALAEAEVEHEQSDKRSRLQVVAQYIKNGTVLFPRAGCEQLLGSYSIWE